MAEFESNTTIGYTYLPSTCISYSNSFYRIDIISGYIWPITCICTDGFKGISTSYFAHWLQPLFCKVLLTVSVREDDEGTLPSQLQRHPLQVSLTGRLHDELTDLWHEGKYIKTYIGLVLCMDIDWLFVRDISHFFKSFIIILNASFPLHWIIAVLML